ncbi:MAG: ABC transporter permease [Bacillota bacterium]
MLFILLESIRTAWLGIAGNKLRSVLTMLGIIIGVAAVIALVSVGQGAQASATSSIQTLGSNLITVSPRGTGRRIEAKDLAEIRARIPGIAAILPMVNASQQSVKSDGLSDAYQVDIEGTGSEYPFVRERGLLTGSFFTEQDVATRRRVAVLGTETAIQLFGEGANPVGQTVRFLGQSWTVLGVAEPKGTGFGGQNQDDRILVPYTTLARALGLNRIQALTVKAQSDQDAPIVTQMLTDFYVEKFRAPDSVRVQSQDQLLETVGQVTGIFTLLLGAIASISLLVGGIGIMNIMLVSVSERTREIGIRKAIGAKKHDVLLQFLIEALILSVTGGLIGMAMGYGGAAVIARVLGFPAVITADSVVLAFGFSAAVGVIFGFYPAFRASNLDPIEALRRD